MRGSPRAGGAKLQPMAGGRGESRRSGREKLAEETEEAREQARARGENEDGGIECAVHTAVRTLSARPALVRLKATPSRHCTAAAKTTLSRRDLMPRSLACLRC